VEGGSANDYDYCLGDPVNCWDLDGTETTENLDAYCAPDGPSYRTTSGFCRSYVKARASGNPKELRAFGIWTKADRQSSCPAWLRTASSYVGYGDFARAAKLAWDGRYGEAAAKAAKALGLNYAQLKAGKILKSAPKAALRGLGKAIGVGGVYATGADGLCQVVRF
jgi:hypothetical protein